MTLSEICCGALLLRSNEYTFLVKNKNKVSSETTYQLWGPEYIGFLNYKSFNKLRKLSFHPIIFFSWNR